MEHVPFVSSALPYSSSVELNATRRALKDAAALILLLDYDGTLVPFTAVPELAVPDADLMGLLARLAARRETEVHVVSGRSSEGLERFFGRLDVTLHAEHAQFKRPPSGTWTERAVVTQSWRPQALEFLRDFADRTPGSFVEEKRRGLAWHYRLADPDFGAMQARELVTRLSVAPWSAPVEVLSGIMVVELRSLGANKGRVASEIVQRAKEGTLIAAFGDDRTDEDMFAALPESALKVHVGPTASQALVRLPSTVEVRAMLASILG